MKMLNKCLTKTTALFLGAVVIVIFSSNILAGQHNIKNSNYFTHVLPSLPTYGVFEYGLVFKNDNFFHSLYGNEGETARFVKVSDSLTLATHYTSRDTTFLLEKTKIKLLSKNLSGISAFAISGDTLLLTISNQLVLCHKSMGTYNEIKRFPLSFYPERLFLKNQKLMILSLYDYHKHERVAEKVCQIFDLSTQKFSSIVNIPFDNHQFYSLVNHFLDYDKDAVYISQATMPMVLRINFELKIDTIVDFKPVNWHQMKNSKFKLNNQGKTSILALKKKAANFDRTLGVFLIDSATLLITFNKKLESYRYHGFIFKKNTSKRFEFYKEIELTKDTLTHVPESLNVSTFKCFENGWLFTHVTFYRVNNEKYFQAINYFDYSSFLD